MKFSLGKRKQPPNTIKAPPERERDKLRSRSASWWQKFRQRLRVVGLESERAYVIENLGMLLAAGMPVVTALNAIQADVRTKRMKRVLAEVAADIDAGSTLWATLERTQLLPEHIVSLIRIGEESGKLPDNLNVIVVQQQKERDFRAKVRSAMLYPVLVLVIAVIIALGMAWFVLPRLVSVFSQLNIELPLVTRLLVQLAEFLRAYGNIVVPGIIIVMIIIVYFLFFFSRTRKFGQMLLFILPGARRLVREIELSRMGYILGTLLEAGLPIIQAIDSLRQATTFYSYQKFFTYMRDQIEEGNSWKYVLKTYKRSRAAERFG